MSNRGFVELHNPGGALIILISALLLTAAIVGTVVFVRLADNGRQQREELRRQLQERNQSE